MKVVINRCFGGFELSKEATELYVKYKYNKNVYWYDSNGKRSKDMDAGFQSSYLIEHGDELLSSDGFFSSYGIERNDDILIKVITELGERANSSCANLKIIEIPDDIDYEINEYDGMETVEETHRSWS